MTQAELMLAKLRERTGEVVTMADLAEHVFAGRVPGPQYPREQLSVVAAQCRKRGHQVELVEGRGYRLIETEGSTNAAS